MAPERIQWGDHTVTLARVEHVACYWAQMSVRFVRASSHFRCWFADDRDEVSIATGAGRVPSPEQRLAEAAVASIVWAWGVAQWSYILPTSLEVSAAAAPSATLATLLVVFGVAAVVIVPALALLYVLDQRSLLPEEGVGSRPAARESTPTS